MNDLPLLNHALNEPTAFRPGDLIAAVREQRGRCLFFWILQSLDEGLGEAM